MKIQLLFVLFLIQFATIAQTFVSPYKLTYKKDASLTGGGVAAIGFSFVLKGNKSPLTYESIQKLNRTTVWKIDRPATYNWSISSAKTSDVMVISAYLFPLLHLIDKNSKSDFGNIVLLQTEVLMLTNGLAGITKELVKRNRPFTYNPDAPFEQKLKHDATSSFFSGHTSNSSVMSFFMAKTFCDYHPDSNLKPVVWSVAAIYPLIVGYLRWRAGKHFLTDIATGYVVGGAVGILLPEWSKRMKE